VVQPAYWYCAGGECQQKKTSLGEAPPGPRYAYPVPLVWFPYSSSGPVLACKVFCLVHPRTDAPPGQSGVWLYSLSCHKTFQLLTLHCATSLLLTVPSTLTCPHTLTSSSLSPSQPVHPSSIYPSQPSQSTFASLQPVTPFL